MDFNSLDIDWEYLLERIEHFLDLGEEYLTRTLIDYQAEPQLFQQDLAFRWVNYRQTGYFEAATFADMPHHANLLGMQDVLEPLCQNTNQFVHGLPCNNILIRGDAGNGKRSAIKGLLAKYASDGLRLIEIHREDLQQLTSISNELRDFPFYFILLCCDLLEVTEYAHFRELRDFLQGGIETRPGNILIYATDTSAPNNMPRESLHIEQGFGMILDMAPMQQATYLDICRHLAQQHNLPLSAETLKKAALKWAESRKTLSGLAAHQFIDNQVGLWRMKQKPANNTPT